MGPRGDSDCDRVEILLLFSSSLLSFLFLFIFSIFRCSKYNKIRNLANNYVHVNARQREFESLILFDPLFSFRGNDSRNFPALSFPFFFFFFFNHRSRSNTIPRAIYGNTNVTCFRAKRNYRPFHERRHANISRTWWRGAYLTVR